MVFNENFNLSSISADWENLIFYSSLPLQLKISYLNAILLYMITITKKENIVLNQIKYFQSEYCNGVPYNILKLDSNLSEIDLRDILGNLENKDLISKSDDYILTKGTESKINVVDSQAEVLKEDLNQTGKKAFEIIKNKSKNGLISRYVLEGNLLYGDLKLSNIQMYHLIIELENKGLIKKIQMKDGEYYSL
ncbi:MAG: hypothetical protein PQ975_08775 [Methanobacterium sp.]